MTSKDMNAQVAEYEATCASIARHVARTRRAQRARAEYDDLLQEGRIHVWLTLRAGASPSSENIELRMWNWVRKLGAQRGQWNKRTGKADEPAAQFVPYDPDTLMPLDDVRVHGDD